MANVNDIFSPRLETGATLPNIKSVKDVTPFIVRKTNGNLDFYYSFLGKWAKMNITSDDELRVSKLGVGLLPTEAITYDITLKNGGQFGNPTYSTGNYKFDGTGYLMDYDRTFDDESFLSIDNLLVRKNLTVFDLLVIQKRFTNGSLFISNGAKVLGVNGTTITFEDPSSTGLCPFAAGDLILSIRYKPDSTTLLRSVYATVVSVSGNTAVVSYTSGTFQKGDDVARVGNTTDATRQGMVYLTADDTTAPFIDIVTGVNSWTAWNSTNKVVARLGRLKDFPTTAFGGTVLPDVIGLFIKNNLYIEDGFIALGTQGYVKSGLTSYSDTTHTGFFLGWDSATNKFKIYNSATKYFDYNGTDFNLLGGNISAGAIKSTGTMTYDRAIAGTEYGYWLGKYNTNDYRFFIGSSATKYLKYDNSDLTFQGGYIQTSDRTDTTKDCIFIDGANNVLEFREGGRVNPTDYVLKITTGLVVSGLPGIRLSDGAIENVDSLGNKFSLYKGIIEAIMTNTGSSGHCIGASVSGNSDDNIALRAEVSANSAYQQIAGYFKASQAGAGAFYSGYFDGGNVYIKDALQVGANKFTINSTGQITKINNVVTSGYVPISNGTHFEPRALTVSDVTNAVSTAGSYANPSWITSLDKSKITGLTASTICASTAGGVLGSTSFAPTILFDPAISYGEMIETNSSTTITMDGTNYVKFTGTATGSCGSGITYSATNDDLTVDAGVQGKYLVTYNVTAKADTAGEYYWAILLTGTAQNKTRQILNHTAINTNYSVSGSAILTLGDGDTIAIGCFGTNTRVVTVTYLNVNITKISN